MPSLTTAPGLGTNWVEGRNPYSLSKPSDWWLKLLFDYDPQLVVMPSVKDCAYRLCRRVRRENRLGLSQMHVHEHPDTVQMIQHGLVPVATMTTWSVRSDKIIRDLMARDTWRHGATPGNANALVNTIEMGERLGEERQDAAMREDFDKVSAEAFRSMQFRNGSAIGRAMRDPRPSKRALIVAR